jgi:hypothetical protein
MKFHERQEDFSSKKSNKNSKKGQRSRWDLSKNFTKKVNKKKTIKVRKH